MRSHPVLRPLFWLAVSWLVLLTAPFAYSQEGGSEKPDFYWALETNTPPLLFLWNGYGVDFKGKSARAILPKVSEKMLRQEISELEQRVIVTRDLQRARMELDTLWLMVNLETGFTLEERRTQLIMLALARSKNFEQSKSLDDALNALNILALTKSPPQYKVFASKPERLTPTLVPISVEHQKFLMQVWEDPQLTERRRVILAQMAVSQEAANEFGLSAKDAEYLKSHFGLPSKDMHQRIGMYLKGSDESTIQQLGLRAAPSLALYVINDLDSAHTFYPFDPLLALIRIDVQGGCALATDYFDKGGPAWKLRILSVIENRTSRGHGLNFGWTSSGNGIPPESNTPYWIHLTTALTGDSKTWRRVLPDLSQLTVNQAIPDAMRANLSAIIKNGPTADAEAVLKAIFSPEVNPNVRSLLIDGLRHSSSSVRQLACRHFLQNQKDVSPMLALKSDPSPEVRKLVAASLAPRKLKIRYGTEYERSNSSRPHAVSYNRENQEALILLLEDPVVEIQRTAAKALAEGNWKFPTAAPYIKALQFADRQLAELLVAAKPSSDSAHSELILTIAKSQNAEVRHALDRSFRGVDWVNDASIFLPAFRARLLHPKDPYGPYYQNTYPESNSKNVENYILNIISGQIGSTPNGQAESIRLLLETERSELLTHWGVNIANSRPTRSRTSGLQEQIHQQLGNGVALLESNFLAAILATVQEPASGFFDSAYQALLKKSEIPEGALQAVILDDSRPIEARTLALQLLFEKQTPRAIDIALAFTSKPLSTSNSTVAKLIGNSYFVDPKMQTTFLDRLRAKQNADPFITLSFFQNYERSSSPNDYVDFLIQPWTFDSYQHFQFFLPSSVINRLAEMDWSAEIDASLAKAIACFSPNLYRPAMRLPSQLKKNNFIPLLGKIIRETDTPGGTSRQQSAVDGLAGFLSKEAAQELISCMSPGNSQVQGAIRKALATIREFESQTGSWENGEISKPSRDGAIAELLVMLDDEDQDIQIMAVNSLAAFGELEVLPRLIQLMKEMDDSIKQADKKVAAAARAAIERLQKVKD